MDFSRFKIKIFLLEAVFYIAAFTVGILSVVRINEINLAREEIARRLAAASPGASLELPSDLVSMGSMSTPQYITIFQFLLAFLLVTAFFWVLIKTKYGGGLLKALFVLAMFAGAEIIFQVWISREWALALASILVFSRLVFPKVVVHNIAVIVAIAGVAVNLALNISPLQAILILIVISVYDFIAVYITGHMVKMFKSTIVLGTAFAMIIPDKFSNLVMSAREIKKERNSADDRLASGDFVYLGGGDLAFPLILVASVALKNGVMPAIFTSIGALIGLFVLNVIFMLQKERKPMPGMPPLAAGAILGFLASFIRF